MAAALCLPCCRSDDQWLEGRIRVFVSIQPQATFVERIGGTLVDVKVLVAPGQSPATYEPTPRQLAMLARAQVFFSIGVPFEKALLKKILELYPALNVRDGTQGIQLRRLNSSEHRGQADPHFWLSPRLLKQHALTIRDELARIAPEHKTLFDRNLTLFLEDLERLDAAVTRLLAPLRGSRLYVFHPTFGYLAEAYGLEQCEIEVNGKSPGTRQLAELIDQARRDGVQAIFVQPEFAHDSARAVAEAIGAHVVLLDPLSRDYFRNLEMMARTIRRSLLAGAGSPPMQGRSSGESPAPGRQPPETR